MNYYKYTLHSYTLKVMSKKDKHAQLSQREHILEKVSMYGATISMDEYNLQIPNEDFTKIEQVTLTFPMILKKLIEEISTNAIDHARKTGTEVKNLHHNFEDGYFTIVNDGKPIPLTIIKNLQGVEMPLPMFLTTEFNTSSNYDKNRTEKTTGGTNGVGIKLTNVFSDEFITEVYDAESKTIFQQTCTDNMAKVSEYYMGPKTKKMKYIADSTKSYTAFRFKPDFKRMGYKKYTSELDKLCCELLRTQVLVAAISNQTKPSIKEKSKVSVFYNGFKCPIKSIKDLAYINTKPIIEVIHGAAKADQTADQDADEVDSEETAVNTKEIMPLMEFVIGDKLPWHIVITCDTTKGLHPSNFTIVNGIYTPQGGTHIDVVQEQIIAYVKPLFEENYTKKYGRKWEKSYIYFLQIYMNTIVELPEFDGQKKGALATAKKDLRVDHDIKESELKKIYKLFQKPMDDLIMIKTLAEDSKKPKGSKEFIPKYNPAMNLGQATLCLCEGTSAQGNLDKVIRQTPDGTKYIGTLALQGVIPNALKESRQITNPLTGETILVRTPKLRDNVQIRAIYNATGIDPARKYDTCADDKHFDKLNYNRILIVTDQDVDGFNIQGLILTLFTTFHKGLFDRGYIRILNTPVIKATIKEGKTRSIKHFHTQKEYDQWAANAPSHDVSFIKGLATNTDRDLLEVLNNPNNNTLQINSLTPIDNREVNVYYGPTPDLRKKALSAPQPDVDITLISDSGKKGKPKSGGGDRALPLSINCELHMHGRVHTYQLDNLGRKLPHVMDGLTEAKSKVIILLLTAVSGKIKAASLAGKVISDMDYHHGGASLGQVILKMSQYFYGAYNIPQVLAIGFSGWRANDEMGADRYVDVEPNKELLKVLYNPLDLQLIEYNNFDGKTIEPKFFIPPVPMVLLNNYTSISNGWNCRFYARDHTQVIESIKRLINGKKPLALTHSFTNFRGKVVEHGGYEWSVGKYEYHSSKKLLIITELPIFTMTFNFIKGDEKKAKKLHEAKLKEAKVSASEGDKAAVTKAKGKAKAKLSANQIGIRVPLIYKKFVKKVEDYSHGGASTKTSKSSSKKSVKSKEPDQETSDINIHVYLEDGAFEHIMETYADGPFDGIEKYFGLNISMKPILNTISSDNTVMSFQTYEDLLQYWYQRRQPYYESRHEREVILLKLRIKYLKNLILFNSEERTPESNKIVNVKNSSEKAIKMLEEAKYQMFNTAILNNPNNIENAQLENAILKDGASYNYILGLTCNQRLKEANKKRESELSKLEEQLNVLKSQTKPFKGAAMWLEELDKIQEVIDSGIRSNWSDGVEESYN